MRRLSLFIVLLLAGCNGEDLQYEYFNSSIVVYRPVQGIHANTNFKVSVNSTSSCKLPNGSYFVTHTLKKSVVTASNSSGTSRISVTPTTYVKIEGTKVKRKRGLGGLLTSGIMDEPFDDSGAYKLTVVEIEKAREEIKTLTRACK